MFCALDGGGSHPEPDYRPARAKKGVATGSRRSRSERPLSGVAPLAFSRLPCLVFLYILLQRSYNFFFRFGS